MTGVVGELVGGLDDGGGGTLGWGLCRHWAGGAEGWGGEGGGLGCCGGNGGGGWGFGEGGVGAEDGEEVGEEGAVGGHGDVWVLVMGLVRERGGNWVSGRLAGYLSC